MTIENLDDITIIFNNLTDAQLAVLKGIIDEEQQSRNEKKIEQYYNKIADLFDEIKENGFKIYYGDYSFHFNDINIEASEEE